MSKVVMIACVSPGSSSSDHSLNTLRYADRLKDQTELEKKCDEIIQQNRSLEAKQGKSVENIHKIDSAKLIKKEEVKNPTSSNKQSIEPKPKNIPKSSGSSNHQSNNSGNSKREEAPKEKNRSNSYKKNNFSSNNASSNHGSSASKNNIPSKHINTKEQQSIIDEEI